MSDLDAATSKTLKGAEWRGTITVPINEESHELTIRQLVDDEFYEISDLIDWDELEAYEEAVPDEIQTEYQDLTEMDDEEMSEDEEARLDELETSLEDEMPRVFDVLSYSTFKGLQTAAKYGVEPDEADMANALKNKAHEIEAEYGVKVSTPEDTKVYFQEQIESMIENSTNFTSFVIGMKVLVETAGGEGN